MEKMSFLKRFWGYSLTINKHRLEVMRLCFKCGLIKQGLLHDLSKYSFIEFFSGVKYYQGYRSPIDAEKEDKGYSLGWLHHKGRNKHHFEFWLEKDYYSNPLTFKCLEMPLNYLLEAACDKIAASKIYKNDKYTDSSAYDFLMNGKDQYFMGPENSRRHKLLLEYLKDNGEEKALAYYKDLYHQWKKDKTFNI